jgi:hypothetical protein
MLHFNLAAALARLGALDEARAAVQAGLALNPGLTINRFRSGTPSDNPDVPRSTRAHLSRHAHGRGAGGMKSRWVTLTSGDALAESPFGPAQRTFNRIRAKIRNYAQSR